MDHDDDVMLVREMSCTQKNIFFCTVPKKINAAWSLLCVTAFHRYCFSRTKMIPLFIFFLSRVAT